MTSTTTRIAAYATAATLALGTVGTATPANAATVAAKDKDGVCAVKLAPAEKRFIESWFDDFKAIGDYEQARDLIAAIEQIYPGVVAENEKALKGEKAEFGKVLPEGSRRKVCGCAEDDEGVGADGESHAGGD